MKNKIKLNDKQKKLLIYGVLIISIMIVLIISVIVGKMNNKQDEQERLTSYLKQEVKAFYEKNYYPQILDSIEDAKLFLSNFEKDGITISIEKLIENNVITEETAKKKFINKDNHKLCNFENTKVIIYPKDPYEKNSYTLKTILDCNTQKK